MHTRTICPLQPRIWNFLKIISVLHWSPDLQAYSDGFKIDHEVPFDKRPSLTTMNWYTSSPPDVARQLQTLKLRYVPLTTRYPTRRVATDMKGTDICLGSGIARRASSENSRSGNFSLQEDPVQFEIHHIESHRTENNFVIAGEVNPTLKELVMDEMSTMIEESLDKILRTSFHNEQSSIWWVVYNVVEQVMLNCYVGT